MFALVAIGFLLGASLGSFLNVCAYRIPRHMSVVCGRSSCPACLQVLPWYDLIPILSFIAICRGRCTHCGARISLQYPAVEFLSGAWVVLVVLMGGFSPETLLLILFGLSMLLVALIDWRHYLIPNGVLLWSLAVFLAIKATVSISALWPEFVALVTGFSIVFLVLHFGRFMLSRDVMGMGDVKLAAVIAFVVGVSGLLLSLWLGALGGIILALLQRTRFANSAQNDVRIPFGSFLALSSVAVALLESETQGSLIIRVLPWLNF